MADPGARVGPWILGLLAERGVDTVFGIPGVHTLPLYDGLAGSGIRHVTPRHEQAAGFMADGYARVTGTPGVCFVISGPGVTNIATAMAQAYADSVPMLVLSSAGHRRDTGLGNGHLHELADQGGVTAGITAFSHTLQDLAELPGVLDRAFSVFASARPRPVHIAIPLDVWTQPVPTRTPPVAPLAAPPCAPADACRSAAETLGRASRPLILAGGGARRSASALRDLAEALDAPVVMTVNGRGLLPPAHPLGIPASPSLDAVRRRIAESDAVLAVGTEIGPTDYDMYETGMPAIPSPLARIDVEPGQMLRNRSADIPLIGDAHATLGTLHGMLHGRAHDRAGAQRAGDARTTARDELGAPMQSAADLLARLRTALPDVRLVGDSTLPVYAGNLAYAAPAPATWFNSATGYGTLGYALPAAIGAALAEPARPVVCLVGDGGLHYTLGELASLRQTGVPVIVLVWNNRSFGEIKTAMTAQGITPAGVDLVTPDFTTLAAAYGLDAARPDSTQALVDAVKRAAEAGTPALIAFDEALV